MPVPVISVAQMRDWEDATWATGQTEAAVIRLVGKRLADRAHKLTRDNDLILILGGKGHNGDDARAAKEFLNERKVKALDLLQPENDLSAVEVALQEKPALVIYCMFGIGFNRPLSGPWQKIIAAINVAKIPVLAVDVPSGLNADTGETFGACIEAAVTLTVGAPKVGMLTAAAWPYVGRLEVAEDVGLIPCPLQSELNWTLPGDFQNFPPPRNVAAHKGSFGHVSIIAGSLGYQDVYYPVAGQLQSAMVNLWQADIKKMANGFDALLVGPGLAGQNVPPDLRLAVRNWWRYDENPLIVDASALELLAAEPFAKKYIRVLTPHPGEAARLLNWTKEKIRTERVKALREISKKFGGCWVVLKGHQTLIGRAEGEIFVNSSGNPYLAQGGSGDLLAGFIAGLLAQPALRADVATTLRYAVWQHGAAADRLQAGRANWTVEDLAELIGDVR
ncbi:MAG: hypothetical protein JF609_04655 [Verrucomicrobia bacterium]|nr:hypothetical protein [Verrucomicrobiota bacterium]